MPSEWKRRVFGPAECEEKSSLYSGRSEPRSLLGGHRQSGWRGSTVRGGPSLRIHLRVRSHEPEPGDLPGGDDRADDLCDRLGEDESLGNFNNSLNIAGTGIIEHDVFMPEAEPGVEYMFVVLGTTADGTLYRSDMGDLHSARARNGEHGDR